MGSQPAGRRGHTVAFAMAVGALVVGSMSFAVAGAMAVSTWHVNWSTRDFIHHGIAEVPARAVAIVPGVGTASRRMPRHLQERLAPALGLYRTGKVRAILVSGIGVGPRRDEVTTMVRWLEARGVPGEHIMSDPAGHRTLDTMQRAAKLLNVDSAIVCTQGVFVARAVFLARAAGIDAVGLAVPSPIPKSGPILRNEALKTVLAVADTYLLDRRPRHDDMHGAAIGQSSEALVVHRPAFSFLTSAINAGTAVSQVDTSP